jgi:hypothetical protein
MTNPFASRGKVTKLSGGSSRASAEWSDNGRTPTGRLCQNRRARVIDANAPVAATERQNTSLWSSVVTFFLEVFALYAASHSALPPTLPKSGSEFRPVEPCVPKRNVPGRERDKLIYLTTSSAVPEALVTEDQFGPERTLLAEDSFEASLIAFQTKRGAQMTESETSGRNRGVGGIFVLLTRMIRLSAAKWAPLPLRLTVGCGFAEHGFAKLLRGPENFTGLLHALGTPEPYFFAWLTILTEIVGGFCVLLGALDLS